VSDSQDFDRLVEQIKALGIDPATEAGSLPPHVRDMLKQYQVSTGDTYVDDADLTIVWNKVNAKVGNDATAVATHQAVAKAQSKGVVTPEEAKTLADAGQDPKDTNVLVSKSPTPRWLLDELQADPTPEQQKRITDEWNTVFGTKFTWDQLAATPQFGDPTDITTKVVKGAVLDVDPIVNYSVTLPGNRSYQVTSDEMKTQFGLYGFKTQDMTRIVRWADTFNLKDSTGNVAWQPLAALLHAKGLDMSVGDYQQNPEIDPETGKVKYHPTLTLPGAGRAHPAPDRKLTLDDLAGKIKPNYKENKKAAQNEMSVAMLTMGFKRALDKYGDPTMAYLGSLDSSLADRLMSSGGDIEKVSQQDQLLAEQYMLNGQWSPDAMHSLGYASGNGLDAFFNRLKGPAAAAVRTRPDMESVKQAAKDLWRKMFRAEPSEKLVNEMAGNLIAGYMAAPDAQQYDINAHLRQTLEAAPEYQSLYGKMQPGQTPEDYQAQFDAAASSMLGGEAAPVGAVTAGMKTGQYQTTVGASAAAGLASQNSTLMGRLATAAQIVNERT
jgi:hypothetical protein